MITIYNDISELLPDGRLGYSVITNVNVKGTPLQLAQEFEQIQDEVSKVYNIQTLAKVPRILAVRSMFKKISCDPSRYRPASEAMVRRILNKKGLYYINSAVDVNNYCSIKYLVPFGLYDLDKINGNIYYCLIKDSCYENIAGNMVSTDSKPFLTDDSGPFGNPTSDARRTAVNLMTKNLLSVVYADEDMSDDELTNILDFAAQKFIQYNGGVLKEQGIVHAG